jgi:hypothetical protein
VALTRRDMAQRLLRRTGPYAIPLVAAALVAWLCLSRVLERAGGPAVPLDDSYIHLQYARQLSHGELFRYTPGAAYSSGATSFLWPLLLAPTFWLGLGDTFPLVVGWVLGFLLHAAVILETARLAEGLAGKSAATAAGATAVVFGAFAWFAYSGMETMALAWILTRGMRVCAEHWEGGKRVWGAGGAPSAVQLAALGAVAPLIRPEGALLSLVAAGALVAVCWRDRRRSWRAWAAVPIPLLGMGVVPLTHWWHTGQALSATAQVKWLLADPYLVDPHLAEPQARASVMANLELLMGDLLNGGDWTRIFVPEGTAWIIALGAISAVVLGWRRRRMRALLLLVLLAGTAIPCTYATILWNRVRYIWPFAPGWIVASACLFAAVGEAASRWRPLARIAAPALGWGAVAMVGAKLDWATQDLATSSRAITLQQVALGRWARQRLPRDAVIGVNDTGAVAYFSRRRTFDVVGLTTPREARYWAAGAGSRFEHYERLPIDQLPTFFIVYPHWMAMDAVLGPKLHQATVLDQSILGGRTMSVHEARWDRLGSGASPIGRPPLQPLDELDVADLESEHAHGYRLGITAARHDVVAMAHLEDGRDIADGGRRERSEDRFELVGSEAARLVIRATASEPVTVRVGDAPPVEAKAVTRTDVWQEYVVVLPAGARRSVVVQAAGPFASWHYWLYPEVRLPPGDNEG